MDGEELMPKEAYDLYLRVWYEDHREGMPVCFEEFIENEYQDEEYMRYLIDCME